MTNYTPTERNEKIIDLENKIIKEMNNLTKCLQNPSSNACANTNLNLQEIQTMIQQSVFLTKDEYNSENANIMNQWQQIKTMRGDLDIKLRELYSLNNSTGTIYKSYVDTTMYTNVLWTVLATSIVYFLFMRIKGE